MEKKRQKLPPVLPADKTECPIITDPQGCYTGRPIEKMAQPVQDADDL